MSQHPRILVERINTDLPDGWLVGAEIGVYIGKTSAAILGGVPHVKKLYMIDPWRVGSYRYPMGRDGISKIDDQEKWDEHYAAAIARVEEFDTRHKIIRERSAVASGMIEDGSLDFVFIDGDHAFLSVLVDCALWWPKVRKGGMFYGHDYDRRLQECKDGYDLFAENIDRKIEVHDWWVMSIRK